MSREVKFRYKYDCPVAGVHYVYYDLIRLGNDSLFMEDFEYCGQFTGLKDKNGKEIYEGDIVKTPHYIVSAVPAYYENHEVIFYKDGFYIKVSKYNYRNLACTESAVEKEYIINVGEVVIKTKPEVEVIGNIYENPELLEEENE